MTKSFENRDGWIWMNGNFIPWQNATSHIISQGLHYASAVFEGERAYNGKIYKSKFIIIGVGINLIKSPKIKNYPTTNILKETSFKVKKYDLIKNIEKNYIKNLKLFA